MVIKDAEPVFSEHPQNVMVVRLCNAWFVTWWWTWCFHQSHSKKIFSKIILKFTNILLKQTQNNKTCSYNLIQTCQGSTIIEVLIELSVSVGGSIVCLQLKKETKYKHCRFTSATYDELWPIISLECYGCIIPNPTHQEAPQNMYLDRHHQSTKSPEKVCCMMECGFNTNIRIIIPLSLNNITMAQHPVTVIPN